MAKRVRKPTKPRRPQVRRPPRPPLLRDPLVASITNDILALLAHGGEEDVKARAGAGGLLRQARDHMPHGTWLRWVEQHLPFSPRTAERAIVLHGYSESKAELFDRVASLGAGKAELLLSLHEQTAERILATTHPIGGASKSVAQMTLGELVRLTKKLVGKPERDPIDATVSGYRRHVRGLLPLIDTLIEHRNRVDEDDVHDLHDDLRDALDRLAAAFDLDDA